MQIHLLAIKWTQLISSKSATVWETPVFTENPLFYGIMHFNNVISHKISNNLDDHWIYCRIIADSLYRLFAVLLRIYLQNKSFGRITRSTGIDCINAIDHVVAHLRTRSIDIIFIFLIQSNRNSIPVTYMIFQFDSYQKKVYL